MLTRLPTAKEQLLPTSKYSYPDKQRTCDQCHRNNSVLSPHFQRKTTTSSTNSSRLQIHFSTNDGTRRLRRVTIPRSSTRLNDRLTMESCDSVNSRIWIEPWMTNSARPSFLDDFNWKWSRLTAEETAIIERLLVKYHRIFDRHRLDTGINNEFKVKLNPKHDESVYVKNLPAPKNFGDEILVELALQQNTV